MHARFGLAGCLIFLLASCSSAPVGGPVVTPAAAVSSQVAGLWTLTVESPMGREDVDASFTLVGDHVSGTMRSAGRDVPLEGTVNGNVLRFDMSLDVRGQALQLDYVGTVEGDTMSGTVQFGPIGTGKFSGTRKTL
jgi:hypothetical protein